jgi:hypothetical protein|tara:strand:+ start:3043 stop:3414 length:372 start_codon:yes stop_codon:yes gene_type:complete
MKENDLHLAICNYIKLQYKGIIFTSENSGLRVFWKQAKMLKKTRSCAGLPDIWILEPRKGYHGLLLEIKREGTRIYKKDGDMRKDAHLKEQEEILHQLKQKGYMAEFVVGFDNAKAILDFYLG